MWRVSSAISGGTPARDNVAYWDGGIPWVSPKDMKRRFIDSSEETITAQAVAETGVKIIAPPVVLIVVRGMILAHTFPVAVTTAPVTVNQDIKALRLRPGVDEVFMAWMLEGITKGLLATVVEEAAHGTKAIRMDQWRVVLAPLPPLGDQRSIAGFLDRETSRIDALVAKKERLIELLQEKRTALITRAVTKGLDPSVPMKDSGVEWLGQIPAHWGAKPFKALLSRNDSGVWGEDSIDHGTIVLRSTEQTVNGEWAIESPATRLLTVREVAQARLEIGDLVVTKSSGSELHIGKTSIVDDAVADLHCCFSNFMQRLRVRGDCQARFFWYLMNSPVARAQFVFLSSTTTGLGNLNSSILGAIRVPAPPQAEQRAVAAFLDRETARIDALVRRVREAIDRLAELRKALISAAVTGKIDVRQEAA